MGLWGEGGGSRVLRAGPWRPGPPAASASPSLATALCAISDPQMPLLRPPGLGGPVDPAWAADTGSSGEQLAGLWEVLERTWGGGRIGLWVMHQVPLIPARAPHHHRERPLGSN